MATTAAVLGPNTRLNNFRLNYLPADVPPKRRTRVLLWINGEVARYRRGSMTIQDALNDQPNTATCQVFAPTLPAAGSRVRITIDVDTPRLLFAGAIQTNVVTFLGRLEHEVFPLNAIDDTFRANRRRPFGAWENVSASQVAAEIVATYCAGFTATHVQASLPAVTLYLDGTEGVNGAMTQLARLIGGYFYWEDYDLHLFNDDSDLVDAPDTVALGTFLHDPAIQRHSDDSQLRTRVYGKGYGTTVPTVVLANDPIVPILDGEYFAPGTLAVLGFLGAGTGRGSTTKIISYTNVQGGGIGTIVGPGLAPTVAPVPQLTSGTGLGLGVYSYAYTWATGSGETVASPIGSVTTAAGITDPTGTPTLQNAPTGSPVAPWLSGNAPIGQLQYFTYSYSAKTSYVDASEMTLLSPNTPSITTISNSDPLNPTKAANVLVSVPYSPDARVKTIWIWQFTTAGGSAWHVDNVYDNVVGTGTLTHRSASVATTGAQPLTNTTPAGQSVTVVGLPLGPSGTTSRKIYRTVVNGSQLKLQQTVSNNTATVSAVDTTPDGSLGANVTTIDTSGLTSAAGQVNPGASSILTSGLAGMPTSGWMRAPSDDYIRYTSISGNTLQGIPVSGVGAITTTLRYGDLLLPSWALVAVVGNTGAIEAGAPVAIWCQVDAYEAQQILAARESTAALASDGVYEHVIVDGRRALASLTALCQADLARHCYPIVTVTYHTRDVKTKSGKLVNIYLDDPPIHETLFIHDVTITELDIAPGVAPRFSVTASNLRYSLEDILRRLGAVLDGSGG